MDRRSRIDVGAYELVHFTGPAVGWDELTPAEARARFAAIMDSRERRLQVLAELLEGNGYRFGADDAALQGMNDFFRLNVERDDREDARGYPTAEWCSVAYDMGLWLGEVLIQRFPQLHWSLDTARKSVSFNRPVLTGFTRVKVRNYSRPLYDRLISYGYGIVNERPSHVMIRGQEIEVGHKPPDEGLFLRIVNSASEYA